MAPFCYNQGCSCPTGYDLVETSEYKICRINEQLVDERLDDDDDDEDDKCMQTISGYLLSEKKNNLPFYVCSAL